MFTQTPSLYNQQQLKQIQAHEHYFVSQLTPPQRDPFDALPRDQQETWLWHQVQLRAEANRAAKAKTRPTRQQQSAAETAPTSEDGHAITQPRNGSNSQLQTIEPHTCSAACCENDEHDATARQGRGRRRCVEGMEALAITRTASGKLLGDWAPVTQQIQPWRLWNVASKVIRDSIFWIPLLTC